MVIQKETKINKIYKKPTYLNRKMYRQTRKLNHQKNLKK